MTYKSLIAFSLLAVISFSSVSYSADKAPAFAAELSSIKTAWAKIKYGAESKDAKLQSLEALETRADALVTAYPDKAEPKTVLATILATEANIIHGLSALPKLKQAKSLLESSIAIDAKAESGNAHAILGALYAQVPGWPVAFGDNKKAASHLQAALAVNDRDVDANYFYGDFLAKQKKYDEAAVYLQKSINAPARSGQSVADAGRKSEAKALLKDISGKASQPAAKQYN